MLNLKTFCLSFLLSGLFINCSTAQDKTFTVPMTSVDAPSSARVNPETNRFESTAGKFSINISQTPAQTRDLGTETANKKGIDVGKMFIWKFEKTFYTVMYSYPLEPDGSPMPESNNELEEFRIGMRKGIARSNAKILSEKAISFNIHPGTEFRSISADGVTSISRIYSINSVGYQIMGGYADDKNEKEVLEVLNSFKLLTEKK